jgi:hypothetical protein
MKKREQKKEIYNDNVIRELDAVIAAIFLEFLAGWEVWDLALFCSILVVEMLVRTTDLSLLYKPWRCAP